MRYDFITEDGEVFSIEASIREGPPSKPKHPETGKVGKRVWYPVQDVWNTDGAHRHMYNKHGDKLDQLNRAWSKSSGESPPPPSKEVNRNSGEPQ